MIDKPMPAKLSDSFIERLSEDNRTVEWMMAKKINELRDYLSDKEEPIQEWVKWSKKLEKKLEASKGECVGFGSFHIKGGLSCKQCYIPPQQEEFRSDCCSAVVYRGGRIDVCTQCNKFCESHKLVKEESRGEVKQVNVDVCRVCGEMFTGGRSKSWHDDKHAKPQLKEESPKEDEAQDKCLHPATRDGKCVWCEKTLVPTEQDGDEEWVGEFREYWYGHDRHCIQVINYLKANFVSKVKIKERINQCGYVQHGRFIDKEDLLESLGLEEL